MKVRDYQTGDALDGTPMPMLIEASRKAPQGAVAATREDGRWWLVLDCDVEFYTHHLGAEVRTVYIEE